MSQRWRAATCFAALCAASCLVAADARAGGGDAPSLRPAIAPAAPSQRSEASAVRPAPRRDPRDTADFRASAVRTGIALVATGVFAWGLGRPGGRSGRLRLGLLVALALCAFASYYQFFRLGHPEGFSTTDNFHYYVGSKYFRELGYYGLYACGIAVLEERGVRVPGGPDPRVRDLRTMALRPAGEVRARGEACRARFSDARWRAFSRDVGFFVEKWPPHIRNAVWRDHGYHPSPVWTLVGGAVAGAAPTSSPLAVRALARADRVIVAATLVFVAWAFGLETACLAAIVWGTGHLWRYTWIGDAFMRHLWWTAAFLGLGALRRGAPGLGGAGIAIAALLRIFPGAFGVGYTLGLLRRAEAMGPALRALTPFAAGAAAATAVLVPLSLLWIDRGLAPLVEFAAKIGEFAGVSATNKMGLGVLVERLLPGAPAAATALRAAAALAYLALFWRGLRDARPWEAAAFGFALVPWITDPTNYYFALFVMGAVLAVRRPLVGVVLLGTNVVWGASGLILYRQYAEYPWAAAVALASTVAIALAMAGRPTRAADEQHA